MFNYFECTVECTQKSLKYYKEIVEKTRDKEKGWIYIEMEDFIKGLEISEREDGDTWSSRAGARDFEFDDENNLMTFAIIAKGLYFEDFFKEAFEKRGDTIYYQVINENPSLFFATNDIENKYYKTKYIVKYSTEDDGGEEYFETRDEVIEFIENIFPNEGIRTIQQIEELNERLYEESDGDYYISILTPEIYND